MLCLEIDMQIYLKRGVFIQITLYLYHWQHNQLCLLHINLTTEDVMKEAFLKNHKVPSPKSLEYQIFGLLYYDYHVHINHFLTIQFVEKGNIKYWKHDNFITLKVKSLLYDIFTHVEWTPLCKSLCLEAHFLERKFEYQRYWTF